MLRLFFWRPYLSRARPPPSPRMDDRPTERDLAPSLTPDLGVALLNRRITGLKGWRASANLGFKALRSFYNKFTRNDFRVVGAVLHHYAAHAGETPAYASHLEGFIARCVEFGVDIEMCHMVMGMGDNAATVWAVLEERPAFSKLRAQVVRLERSFTSPEEPPLGGFEELSPRTFATLTDKLETAPPPRAGVSGCRLRSAEPVHAACDPDALDRTCMRTHIGDAYQVASGKCIL